MVSTFAGKKNDQGWTDGVGTNARFRNPVGVAVDGSNNVFVADTGNNMIRMITSSGVVSTIAGNFTSSFADGFGTNAYFNGPRALAVDIYGTIYVGDSGNNRIRKIVGGVVTTMAGSATAGNLDGNGASASFNFPIGVAVDTSGNVYVADSLNHVIRKINSIGSVTTLAGSGVATFADGTGNAASFNYPYGAAVDSSGNVFVSDNFNNRIRKVSSSGVVTTIAGSWGGPFSDGVGSWAYFNYPSGIAIDSSGTDKENFSLTIIKG
jgi:sugar lactone lactonase YvrE